MAAARCWDPPPGPVPVRRLSDAGAGRAGLRGGLPRPGGGWRPRGCGLQTGQIGPAAPPAAPEGSAAGGRTRKGTTSAPAGSSAASGGSRRLQQTQNQVDEVVDIMRVNVDKVLERDQKLSELDDRADALQAGASQFETSAAKLKRKYWWKNCKMWAIGISVVVIIIVIIIVWSVSS
ncbi:vesicle-associated membrane protein 3 isoform X1 [Delphinus delphis]|uniref:vesicle-associated membrane protein 3 isoform X1 n=1 Tax=Delphinus delphis TaxID=9728 RepID=UPI0028C3B6A0|nr:vesicle-associated membrane protein 3 isoform X1 [Delphinus delphis]